MSFQPARPPDSPAPDWQLSDVVAGLRASREVTHNVRHKGRIREMPSREAIAQIIQGLCAALFPTHYGRPDLSDESIDYFVGNTLNSTLVLLAEQVRRGLLFVTDVDTQHDAKVADQAHAITREFASQLPGIRALLVSDLQAAYQGDPAATSVSEILLCYPGMTAIIYYRLAHALYKLGAPILARLISELAHASTGIDIHPGADIGGAFFIDHGTGVVIGETTVIGQGVRLYQAVTHRRRRPPAQGPCPSPHRGRRRRHLRGRHGAGAHHDRQGLDHRRQCVADPKRAARQQCQSGLEPQCLSLFFLFL